MNANNTVSMYEAVPVVSELNKVPGFDPLKYLRKTKSGWNLDLKIKKLWFQLKYPSGRIRMTSLKITDQLAIIEARVYFDKNDTQPVASFTAQRENKATPGGLYIEAAQHTAMDEALSAAGFGIQFIPATASETAPVQNAGSAMRQETEQRQKNVACARKGHLRTYRRNAGYCFRPVGEKDCHSSYGRSNSCCPNSKNGIGRAGNADS